MLRMRFPLLLFFCCFLSQISFAQNTDTIPAQKDSIPLAPLDSKKSKIGAGNGQVLIIPDSFPANGPKESFFHRYFIKKYPNPRAAALLSFILPGAGQAYNKKWWKIPIVYGALGGMAWLSLDNDHEYQRLKKNYKLLVDGDPDTNPTEAPYTYMNPTQMKGYRDQFRGFTEKSYLFLGITYLLGVTDAFVDAHLAHFDVSDDLTLRLVPDIQSGTGGFGACFGVGVRLGFGNPSRNNVPKEIPFSVP